MALIRKLLQQPVYALLVCCCALAGCNDEDKRSAAAPGLDLTVLQPPKATPTNRAPAISGTPTTSAKVNEAYVFQPLVVDPDGDTVTFTIANKPTWATFDAKTGRLAGTPSSSSTGTFQGVRIAASDGKVNSELAPFDITVAATAANGSATLSWLPPTENVDGTPLTNLAGYVIRYGTDAGALQREVRIANPGVTMSVIEDLAPGPWYFTVTAFNSTGIESAPSPVGSKTVT